MVQHFLDRKKTAEEYVDWGPVSDSDTVRIVFPQTDPSKPEQWVDVKRYVTEEDEDIANRAASAQGMKVLGREERRKVQKSKKSADMMIYFDQGKYRRTLMLRVIKGWSFTRDNQPIQITEASIGTLPQFAREYILDQIEEMNPNLSDEEDEDNSDEEPGVRPEDHQHPLDDSTEHI